MPKKALAIIFIIMFIAFTTGCEEEYDYHVNLDIFPPGSGQVFGEGTYPPGTEVIVEAKPAEGYMFKNWVEEGERVSTEKNYRFNIKKDRRLISVFEEAPLKGEIVEYDRDNDGGVEVIKVLDKAEKVIYEYTIEEFKHWAEAHWDDIFEESPVFVEEEPVFPDQFMFFDDTAALSPDGEKLAFSVHRYFAATYMSFVGIVNLETEEVALVGEENPGAIQEFYWSHQGEYLAYALNTAKGEGTYLSNDNVINMEKEFILTGDDLEEALITGEEQVELPHFKNLSWLEAQNRLNFTSDVNVDGENEVINWSIEAQGSGLSREQQDKESAALASLLRY